MKILHKNDKSYLTRSAICIFLLKRVMQTAYCNIGAMQNKYELSTKSCLATRHPKQGRTDISGATWLSIWRELSVNRIKELKGHTASLVLV